MLTFFSFIVFLLHLTDPRTRLWHECTQLLSEEGGQSLWNQPEITCRSSVSSLPGLHRNTSKTRLTLVFVDYVFISCQPVSVGKKQMIDYRYTISRLFQPPFHL